MTAVELFAYEGQQVRTVVVDGEPWFVAADVCRILDLGNVSMAVSRLDSDGVSSAEVIDSMGRQQTARIITEPALYELAFQSRKREAKALVRWVTHDVLPSIRRTGSYSAAAAVPRSLPEALRAYALEVEAREALTTKVARDAPKVLFADAVAASESTVLVGELAKILRGNGVQIGQNRLFERLREDGYLIRRAGSDWNMPTQRSMELGLFEIKETAITHSDGHVSVNKTSKVTGKGQAYFVNRYARELADGGAGGVRQACITDARGRDREGVGTAATLGDTSRAGALSTHSELDLG